MSHLGRFSDLTRHCLLCGGPVEMMEDTGKRRLYECPECEAVEVITKGKNSWWYHGCVRPDGIACNGDGNLRSNARFGWWMRA